MLAMDLNSLLPGVNYRTDHLNKQVNLAYLDGHVRTVPQLNNALAIRPHDYAFASRMAQIIDNGDWAENNLQNYPYP